ncbi:chitinase, partial [Asbolus verrucosus]
KVVCYLGTWSTYRWGNGKFTVEDIDPNLCTHVIYSFVGIRPDGSVRLLDEYLDVDTQNFNRFNALRQKNSNLKTLIAIGGWNEGSANYSSVAADPIKRATFINSALELVQTWGFDGFDLDWEYPNQRGGVPADKENYVTLIKEFREVWNEHGLLLTAAVAAAAPSVDLSYDVPGLSKYLDLINVMTYDLHGPWDDVTGQNAPLYASPLDVSENQKLLNVDAAIRGWIARGADPQKLALGMGTYGRTFTLSNQNNNKLGAPVTGGGNGGKYTSESGMIGYNEIVELQNGGGWTVVWDDEQKVPYMYKGNQWIGYDNPRSIAIKVEYAKSLNLGGTMIWSIETDDFKGLSGTKYPILNTINQALAGTGTVPQPEPEPEPTTEPEPEATTAAAPETEAQPEATSEPNPSSSAPVSPTSLCVQEGYVRDPDDCSVFYYCMIHKGQFIQLTQKCHNGLVYDQVNNQCNYPSLVEC